MYMGEQTEYEVIFYDLPDGTEPALKFIDSQPLKMSIKILWTISLLECKGPSLRMPYSEDLGDGIFELRTILGSDITRVLYFFVVGKKAILTHGFNKKTNKTPPAEIERAKKYRAEYLSRKDGKEA
jgi:phage-related protein